MKMMGTVRTVLQYEKQKWSGRNFSVFMKLIKSDMEKNNYKINYK